MFHRYAAPAIVLLAWCSSATYARQTPAGHDPDRDDRKLAIALVRTINTAETAHRTHAGGTYAAWAELSASAEFSDAIGKFSRANPKLKEINSNRADEVIPGWALRLTVSPDGKAYVIVLANSLDKQCAYAFVSAEDGLIREARAVGCSGS